MYHQLSNQTTRVLLATLFLTMFTAPLSAQQIDEDIEQVDVIGSVRKSSPTEIDPDTQRLLKVPGASNDPLAALQALPGVTFGSDSDSEPAVRGSAPEENTYLIDFIPAAYVFHIFGDSIFNENLIRDFDLYPAAYGNRYSQATGAVIDVSLRDPRNQPLQTTLDYSFLRTGVFLESGITDNQAIYFSYRRSLIDLYLDTGDEEEGIVIKEPPVADDYQLKYVLNQSDTSKWSLVMAGASDKAKANFTESSSEAAEDPDFLGPAELTQRFDSQGLVWDLAFEDSGANLKTALSHSEETTEFDYGTNQFSDVTLDLLILKSEYTRPLNANHWLITGVSVTSADLVYELDAKIETCSYFEPDCSTTDAPRYQLNSSEKVKFLDMYIEDEWYIGDRWVVTPGVHLSSNDYLDEEHVEARIRARYQINDQWTLTGATGQYHIFPGIGDVLPEIGNPDLESPESTHYVLGLEQEISDTWNWKTEIYYKDMDNQVLSLSEGSDEDFEKNYSNDATGEAYGLEFLINRNLSNDWYGWASLSFAKSERTNERTGETLPFDYDRPVIINVVANRKLNDLWNIGLRWKIQSGALYTPIVGLEPSTTQPDVDNPVYGKINSERLPAYHRMDVRVERLKHYSWGSVSLYSDILNFYNQENIEGYSYAPNGEDLVKPPTGYASNIPVTKETGIDMFFSIGAKITF